MDNTLTISLIFSAITLVIAILSFYKNNTVSKQWYEKDKELSAVFLKYESRFTKLETQAELWHKAIERDIGNMIHSPHRSELDALIEKNNNPNSDLTREEAREMVLLLDKIMETEDISQGERFGITVLKSSLISRFRLEELVA